VHAIGSLGVAHQPFCGALPDHNERDLPKVAEGVAAPLPRQVFRHARPHHRAVHLPRPSPPLRAARVSGVL